MGLIARGWAGLQAAAANVEAEGGKAAFAAADVTCSASLAQAAAAIIAELGTPDVWINCAGNGIYGRFTSVPEIEFNHVTAVTYGGTVNGCRIALDLMRPRGRGTIVNVCSAVAYHGMPLMASYAGAKAAVRGFGQSVRAELRIERSAIRLCAVFPPAVNTPFFSHAKSYMGWPARPAPPVYQPEVVAAGIYLAAQSGAAETVISGTVAIFAFVNRVSPQLIAWAMTKLGFEGQLTRDAEASRLEEPTLFVPSPEASPVHGPFSQQARRRSLHLWLSALAARSPLPARPALPAPHPTRVDLGARPGAS